MSEQKQIPFDLDKFKAGMKAKWGKELIKYTYTATNGLICFELEDGHPVHAELKCLIDTATMISRHQHLIDTYNPSNCYQCKYPDEDSWFDRCDDQWLECLDYRIHPHNDLIKAWKKGAKILVESNERRLAGDTMFKRFVDDPHPTWDENKEYRIKLEPTIHCLAYDAKRFNHEQTTAVRARVVKKEVAQANGLKIIQEWEV